MVSGAFRIGDWRVDPSLNSLSGPERTIHLEPKVVQVLVCLAEHPGTVISKERLLQHVWPGTFVTEDVLTRAICELRQAFGDDARNPQVIQTIPKSGYRVIAPIVPDGDPAGAAAVSTFHMPAENAELSRAGSRRSWLALALIGVVAAVAVIWWISARHRLTESGPTMRVAPFSTFAGREHWPAFSPDGTRIAFGWDRGASQHFNIYVKLLDAPEPLRLTTGDTLDTHPAWSPDGQQIAFTRGAPGQDGLYIVPALGGSPRKVANGSWETAYFSDVDWSPDGRQLAVVDKTGPGTSYSVHLIALETLASRQLTHPSPEFNDAHVAFSPDGGTIAFTRRTRSGWGVMDVFVVPITGGEPTRLTFDDAPISDLRWSAHGEDVIFSSRRAGTSMLWRVPRRGGVPARLEIGEGAIEFAVDRRGRIAYTAGSSAFNLRRLYLASSGEEGKPRDEEFRLTGTDVGPQFSPDGEQVAFASARTGGIDIWVADRAGSNLKQLSFFGGHAGTPRWAPDGRQLAFDARPQGQSDIYIVSTEGGLPRRLTTDPTEEVVPSWSRDGRSVYFASTRTGRWQVYKMPIAGGPSVQVTANGGLAAFESADGRSIYFTKFDSPGVWQVSSAGGGEIRIVDGPAVGYWGYWAPVERGIYFIVAREESPDSVAFYDFATREVRQIATLHGHVARFEPGLAISPDGRTLLYVQTDARVDIMLAQPSR